ncbi:potassium-transporting ATPase subunit F [Microbacterium sp. CFH 90308]|uniref:Potassium-transporting ATPase subunit F n=1 Tax=Microbacterium salsuginis TaxID=2722803 RepID=A0ABX1KD36_9MICO|nr:potassium-transporting ATPase subunit F [Microbacterium sp. CFH 90308]NLP84957.1 potassium-transporting ATPase subunit F [Microbacterium sp. CFH 90308]
MIVLSVIAGLLGLAAVVYLVVTLVKPEKF